MAAGTAFLGVLLPSDLTHGAQVDQRPHGGPELQPQPLPPSHHVQAGMAGSAASDAKSSHRHTEVLQARNAPHRSLAEFSHDST